MSINIKDIKNKDKCIKNDISNISENKGILLALLYFILKKYKHLINLKIKINLSKYQKILKLLFSDLKFSSSDKDTFNININTKEQGDLNITFINFFICYYKTTYNRSNASFLTKSWTTLRIEKSENYNLGKV